MIRGIIFDCFGVLYQGSLGHLHELAPEARREELADLSRASDYGYISRTDYVEQVSQLLDKTTTEIDAIMRADHVRNQAMIDVVRSYRKDYKIALLSNVGRGVMEQLFTPQELRELFDIVVLSSEVGMVKPDPAIYQLTSDKLGILPEECLMVDDLKINIEGAGRVGMPGVVFNTTEKFLSDATDLLGK